MASIVVSGNTSGTITISAPLVAGSNTITLPASTGTATVTSAVVSAVGQIPFSTDGSTWTPTAKIVQGTAVASTSGTSIPFTGIPAWAKKITVMFVGVSTAGTNNIIVQIGSGSPTTTGYSSASSRLSAAGATAFASATTGFNIHTPVATDIIYGSMIISNITGNTWVQSNVVANIPTGNSTIQGGGASANLSGALDRVVITTVGGDTFDGGVINVMWEG